MTVRSSQIEPDPDPDFDPDFDLPEPAPENEDGDAYDQVEGYPTDIEDVAIVCWEALRGYRETQGSHTYPPWLRASKFDTDRMVRQVQAVIDRPEAAPCDNKEHRLIAAIVGVLTSP